MILVDNVYQKVLALANKEQRGYISPQEFDLFAMKAQLEIFENYFHDMKTAQHKQMRNQASYSDDIEMLLEKLQPFRHENNTTFTMLTGNSLLNLNALSPRIYRLDTLSRQPSSELLDINYVDPVQIAELKRDEILHIENNPLTKATKKRPTFVREGSSMIRLYPVLDESTTITVYYWRRPHNPHWGFVVVNQKALYNVNTTTNFELHASEEENLVSRILELSGISIEKQNLQQAGMMDRVNSIKEKND